MKTTIGIRVDPALRAWLDKEAARRRTTVSEVVRQIVYAACDASRTMEARHAGREKVR
jgi:predicted transcriptional regulator